MSISSKILTAIALAVALSPMAAHAQSARLGPAQYYLAALNHQDQVMTGSATIDDPTTIYSDSGVSTNAFPDTVGG